MSTLRRYAQIGSRTPYLVAFTNGTGFTPAQLETALDTMPPHRVLLRTTSVVNVANATTLLGSIATTAIVGANSYKDMGRTLILQSMGKDVYRFSLVQPINGPTTEGVPGSYSTASLYVCTWSADPATKVVTMTRTG